MLINLLAQQAPPQYPGLTGPGWALLIFCVGVVTGMLVFCYYKLLSEPNPSQHHHAPLDIDTHDAD